jgi:hypothetical protein
MVLGDPEPSTRRTVRTLSIGPPVRARMQRCTEALCDGEDAEVYSNRGSAHLMIDEI